MSGDAMERRDLTQGIPKNDSINYSWADSDQRKAEKTDDVAVGYGHGVRSGQNIGAL